jgi:prolyl-tRNA synthetase
VTVKVDDRDTQKPGWKFAEYELKGVPLRIAVGPRDLQNGTVEVARRDTLTKEVIPQDQLTSYIPAMLDRMQIDVYNKALNFRTQNTYTIDTWEGFLDRIEKGGFISAHWDGDSGTEKLIQEETKATIRCIPLDTETEPGFCVRTGKPSTRRVLFARAY